MKNVVNTADLVIAWLPELSKGIQYVLMIFFFVYICDVNVSIY